MPGPRLELGLPCGKGILSPSRLPVSPSWRSLTDGERRTIGHVARNASGAFIARHHRATHRAGNGTRTRDPNLGKVVLYQLSYSRECLTRKATGR